MTGHNTASHQIRARIDARGFAPRQLLILAVCFLLNVADGFDVVAISMAASHIAAAWQIDATVLGVVLSSELVGMMVGSIVLASVSDRYGRRTVLLGSVSTIAVAMLLTAHVSSISQLLILRVATGLGIGGVLASAAATASEFSPQKYRNTAVIIVTSGFACGALIVGPIAAYFLSQGNWPALFTTGGTLGLILFLLVLLLVPESLEFVANQPDKNDHQKRLNKINRTLHQLHLAALTALPVTRAEDRAAPGSVRGLLSDELRSQTIRLWSIFFLGSWIIFLLMKWTPKLFVDLGFELNVGIYALTIMTIGGLCGNFFIGILASRLRLTTVIPCMFISAGALLTAYCALQLSNITALYTLLFFINFFATGSMTGMYAVTINNYPGHLRATGLGWGVGLGRTGAIIAPVFAGFLVDAGWNMWGIYLALGVPVVLLAALLVKSLPEQRAI
jgi:benzoate transport